MTYSIRNYYLLISLIISTLMITACGGGGGGDGRTDYQPIVYSGNKDAAVISTQNATSLVNNIIGSSEITDHIPPSAILIEDTSLHASGLITTIHRLDNRFRNTFGDIPNLTSTSLLPAGVIHIDETDYCDSGSIKSTGTLNDDGTGTLEVHYDNCRYGDETTDGYLTVLIDAFDIYYGVITDGTINITRMTITGTGYDVSASGSSRLQVTIGTETETLTLIDLVMRDNLTGHMWWAVNLVNFKDYIYTVSVVYTETFTGRLYDSAHGYIDIITQQPLLYATYDSLFPSSGQMRITGADNAHLRVTVLSETLTLLELDLNNNGEYEITGEIPWDVISIAGSNPEDLDGDGLPDGWEATNGLNNDTYADASEDSDEDMLSNYGEYLLGTDPTSDDTDSDSMPDGWEVDFELNPLSDADAALDFDGDEASNAQEYNYGTDPTDPVSTPANLAVSKTVSLSRISAQTLFEYTVSITNLGPGTARGVSLTDTLPEGAEIYMAVSGRIPVPWGWSCNVDTNTLTCQPLDHTMSVGEVVSIVLPMIAPAVTGDITNSATIESTTLDFASDNDTATVDTSIASAVLTQVDSMIDGENGVDGMERPFRLAISPDGKHIYVPGIIDDAVAVFTRDLVTGTLTFIEAQRDGLDTPDQPDWPKAVAVSPDGNSVYVTTEWEGKLVVYSRNTSTGALTYIETHQGVVGLALGIAVTVSADSENVYVAGPGDNAVAVFDRNTSTGQLTYSTAVVDGDVEADDDIVDGLAGAFDVALSPDDAYLYVAGDAIAVFKRGSGGALNYVGATGGFNLQSIGVSGDGKHLYGLGRDTATFSLGLSAFTRNTSSGLLTHLATYANGDDGIVSLDGMYGLAIAPDGGYVYVAATHDSALGVFARDSVTGTLRFIEVHKHGVGGIDGLGVAMAVEVSPDNAYVYTTASSSNALSGFSIDLTADR